MRGRLTKFRFLACQPYRGGLETHALGSEDGGAGDASKALESGHVCICFWWKVEEVRDEA